MVSGLTGSSSNEKLREKGAFSSSRLRADQRIFEMFAEPVESRTESREHVTNVVKRHRRDRDLQMQPVAQLRR